MDAEMIKQVDLSEISRSRRYHDVWSNICEFIESGWDACEIDIQRYSTPETARQTYASTITRKHLSEAVKPTVANEKLYLVKKRQVKII